MHPELERMIGNAICDASFAADLLADPARALCRAGYASCLSREEQRMVGSVQGARSLAEFAAILHQRLTMPSIPRQVRHTVHPVSIEL